MRHLLVNEPFDERTHRCSDPAIELWLLSSRGGLSDVLRKKIFKKKPIRINDITDNLSLKVPLLLPKTRAIFSLTFDMNSSTRHMKISMSRIHTSNFVVPRQLFFPRLCSNTHHFACLLATMRARPCYLTASLLFGPWGICNKKSDTYVTKRDKKNSYGVLPYKTCMHAWWRLWTSSQHACAHEIKLLLQLTLICR